MSLGRLSRYVFAVGATVVALALQLIFWRFNQLAPFLFFYGAVLLSAWAGGLGPGLVSVALSLLAVGWFLLEPLQGLPDVKSLLPLGFFAAIATVMVALMAREKRARAEAERVGADLRHALGTLGEKQALLEDALAQRKKFEVDLERRAELEQQLVGIVSHDLRNPLHTIMLAAQVIVMNEDADERVLRAGSRILSSVERAQRLIADLLDLTQARLGGGIPVKPTPHDLHRVVKAALDDVRMVWPDRVIIHEEAGDCRGEWDGDRVTQVVANLVTNAVRYSPRETPVTVRTRPAGDDVIIEVHNLGEPIPPESLRDLFRPLTRGALDRDRIGRSVGLGLFIVDQLAHAHGGDVIVTSTHDEGTTFRVRLPRRPGAAVAPSVAPRQEAGPTAEATGPAH